MNNAPEGCGQGTTFVLLSLGANIGDKRKNISKALDYISASGILVRTKNSSIYLTEPVGFKDQPTFFNAAVSGYTALPLNILIEMCKSCEYFMGRKQTPRWHEREIDIDILLFGSAVVESKEITVPHPLMHERRFVLAPAAEIAGETIHPILKITINELLRDCKDAADVELLGG